MAFYSKTEKFMRAASVAIANLARMPDLLTTSQCSKSDLISNARAYLAAANAISAAAAAVLSEFNPPPAPKELHHHFPPLPPCSPVLAPHVEPTVAPKTTERLAVPSVSDARENIFKDLDEEKRDIERQLAEIDEKRRRLSAGANTV